MRIPYMAAGIVMAMGLSTPAWAQSASLLQGGRASLLQGTATPQPQSMQTQTVIDQSPLVAPIPNQGSARPSLFSRMANVMKFPTIGSNPVAAVKTRATAANAPSPTVFQPQKPFLNNQ